MDRRKIPQLVEAPKPKQLQSSRGAARFIADMTLQLRNIAKERELLTLQGLLEVTYYEAFELAHLPEIDKDEHDYLVELSGKRRKPS